MNPVAKIPAPFTFANTGRAYAQTTSDTVLWEDSAAANPDGWKYFFIYTLAAFTATIVYNSQGDTITLTSVPAFTVIPIPCYRVNVTALTGTFLCLVPMKLD